MATLKHYSRNFNWGIRQENVNDGHIYINVKPGENYDLVNFTINEFPYNIIWPLDLCVPSDFSEKELEKLIKEHLEKITEKDIKDFKKFIDEGDQYGWD